jgi:hypothetical protein
MARCLLRDGVSKIIELVGVSPESWWDGPKPPANHARKALYLLTFEKSLLNLGHAWQVTLRCERRCLVESGGARRPLPQQSHHG